MNMLLIKNGTVRLKKNGRTRYEQADILIAGNTIQEIEPSISCPQAAVLDANDHLVIPGLVNCHIHSHDNFNRAWLDNMPLETWMAVVRPFFSGVRHTPEQVYYRTMLGAIEMLRTGTTAVMDDVLLNSILDEKSLKMVMKAYEDIGMRAVVLPHTKNIAMEKTIPYAEELFTDRMKKATNISYPTEETILGFMEENIQSYNRSDRIVTMGLSSSAPQRSTVKLMRGFQALAQKYEVPVACHVLETYVQKRTGDLFYGKSLVKYLADLKLLDQNLVLIHCNWINHEDMELIQRSGSQVVHNPACNMKMGSGIAPVYDMIQRFPVGLGTDNISANDSANLFEAMKLGALLSKIRTPEFRHWLNAEDVVDMATLSGSRCLRKEAEIGTLEVGKKADIALLSMRNERLVMAADYDKALVYGENANSVDTVLVDGKIVVKAGKLTNIDEEQLFETLHQIKTGILTEHSLALQECVGVTDVFEQCYRLCNGVRLGKEVNDKYV